MSVTVSPAPAAPMLRVQFEKSNVMNEKVWWGRGACSAVSVLILVRDGKVAVGWKGAYG